MNLSKNQKKKQKNEQKTKAADEKTKKTRFFRI